MMTGPGMMTEEQYQLHMQGENLESEFGQDYYNQQQIFSTERAMRNDGGYDYLGPNGEEIDEEMENEMMAREEDFDVGDYNYS